MAPSAAEAVTPRPVALPPASPSEMLTYIISHCRHPTTVLVGSAREEFALALAQDITPSEQSTQYAAEHPQAEAPALRDGLLRSTILQAAVSRHIRVVFLNSVTHLRAWTAVFSPSDSRVSAPPAPQSSEAPSLLVYGLVALHQDTSEWSAQGVGTSVAGLVDAAARHGFRAVLMEPKERGTSDKEHSADRETEIFGDEKLPLLKGMAMREDGTWAGRTVELHKVLGRWFDIEHHTASS